MLLQMPSVGKPPPGSMPLGPTRMPPVGIPPARMPPAVGPPAGVFLFIELTSFDDRLLVFFVIRMLFSITEVTKPVS